MANRWNIPIKIEELVLQRDKNCVYCNIPFVEGDSNPKTRRTWEHIINDIRLNGSDNIALCCGSCNASKGSKMLQDWLGSKYCLKKGIARQTVAEVVRRLIGDSGGC